MFYSHLLVFVSAKLLECRKGYLVKEITLAVNQNCVFHMLLPHFENNVSYHGVSIDIIKCLIAENSGVFRSENLSEFLGQKSRSEIKLMDRDFHYLLDNKCTISSLEEAVHRIMCFLLYLKSEFKLKSIVLTCFENNDFLALQNLLSPVLKDWQKYSDLKIGLLNLNSIIPIVIHANGYVFNRCAFHMSIPFDYVCGIQDDMCSRAIIVEIFRSNFTLLFSQVVSFICGRRTSRSERIRVNRGIERNLVIETDLSTKEFLRFLEKENLFTWRNPKNVISKKDLFDIHRMVGTKCFDSKLIIENLKNLRIIR